MKEITDLAVQKFLQIARRNPAVKNPMIRIEARRFS